MNREITIGVLCLIAASGLAAAQDAAAQAAPAQDKGTFQSILENETLTNNWFGFGEEMDKYGLEIGASITNVYQTPFWTKNGHTNKHDNAYSMSYDLEATVDLQTLFKIPGASIYVAAEGGWHDGIDPSSVGSITGVNDDATGNARIIISEAYYDQELFDGMVLFKIGKLDIGGGYECRSCSGAFDGNRYAEDETSQFLNGAFTGNPTIDMPDNGLGAIVHVEPVEMFYISAGISDMSADERDITFDTAFNGHEDVFVIAEVGFAPVLKGAQGVYRVGGWFNNSDYISVTGTLDNEHYGMYISCDQELAKENDHDDQGLGVFGRFGITDDDIYAVSEFWSVGLQYTGLIPSRDADVIGIGFASSEITDELHYIPGLKSAERVFEAYYNIMVTDYLQVSPDIQFVNDAGAVNRDAFIGGLRVQVTF